MANVDDEWPLFGNIEVDETTSVVARMAFAGADRRTKRLSLA